MWYPRVSVNATPRTMRSCLRWKLASPKPTRLHLSLPLSSYFSSFICSPFLSAPLYRPPFSASSSSVPFIVFPRFFLRPWPVCRAKQQQQRGPCYAPKVGDISICDCTRAPFALRELSLSLSHTHTLCFPSVAWSRCSLVFLAVGFTSAEEHKSLGSFGPCLPG